jgi:predicted TIM-barrel fold metal-dependent hydrolase
MGMLVEMLGLETLMFSTDYPHWDGDTPERVFQTQTADDKKLIFHASAEKIFRL